MCIANDILKGVEGGKQGDAMQKKTGQSTHMVQRGCMRVRWGKVKRGMLIAFEYNVQREGGKPKHEKYGRE